MADSGLGERIGTGTWFQGPRVSTIQKTQYTIDAPEHVYGILGCTLRSLLALEVQASMTRSTLGCES